MIKARVVVRIQEREAGELGGSVELSKGLALEIAGAVTGKLEDGGDVAQVEVYVDQHRATWRPGEDGGRITCGKWETGIVDAQASICEARDRLERVARLGEDGGDEKWREAVGEAIAAVADDQIEDAPTLPPAG